MSNIFIKWQAKVYAEDQKMCQEVLVGLLLTYLKFYSDFMNQNLNQVQQYLSKEDNRLDIFKKEKLNNLMIFLDSGKNLINQETKTINEEEFAKYLRLNSQEDSRQWNEFIFYAEKDLALAKISNLNYNLQFIVAFYQSQEIKEIYFDKIISQILETENKSENLFKKIFEDEKFGPTLNENVHLG